MNKVIIYGAAFGVAAYAAKQRIEKLRLQKQVDKFQAANPLIF